MPLDRVDQLPLPNLHWYSGFSGLSLFYALVYGVTTHDGLVGTFTTDMWCAAAALNMCCCCFFLLAKFIYALVFGDLQNVEQQHMRDKFWNFVFYKFIFVFGVMNVQGMQEMLYWCVWFALLGTLLLTEQLCKDRFQFLSFSPNIPTSAHAKIITLDSVVILSCAGLFMVCAIVGWQLGFNYFTFLYSEVFILFASALHTIIRYIIHLWDMQHDGTWENRSTYTYYAELFLEVAALCVNFLHHIHMLMWANMFLSVASLILLMKLRFLYQEIQRRLKKHHNYVLVSKTLVTQFAQVNLVMSDEICAICWEKMNTARKLPCGHLFHMGCLRSWLEQATVCPTCRCSLSEDLHRGSSEGGEAIDSGVRGRRRAARRIARNWLLYFNGASIANWLPTFSLQLHQEDERPSWAGDPARLHREAQRIHSIFPDIPLQALTLDLADTRSVSLTAERIINGIIYIPDEEAEDELSPPMAHSPAQPHTSSRDTFKLSDLNRHSISSQPPSNSQHNDLVTTNNIPVMENNSNQELSALQPSNQEPCPERSTSDCDYNNRTLRRRLGNQNCPLSRESSVLQSDTECRPGIDPVKSMPQALQPPDRPRSTNTVDVPPFASTKEDSFLTSFTSLVERKECLLKRARRQYIAKEQGSDL